jgi:hypothetical protein
MNASATMTCTDALANQPAIVSDRGYGHAAAEVRLAYEMGLADCDLAAGKAQAALDLAIGWPDSAAVSRDSVRARAEGALGHREGVHQALETLSRETEIPAAFFVETSELWPNSTEDWYMRLAIQAWGRAPGQYSLRGLAASLVHHAGRSLLGLAVASADPERKGGDWAAWTGLIEDARLDREGSRTLFKAQGVDVKDEVTEHEEVVKVETTRDFFNTRHAVSVPKYATKQTHRDVFLPNGKRFFVRYAGIDKGLVGMRVFTAVGRYAGRDGDAGPPVLDALVMIARDQ